MSAVVLIHSFDHSITGASLQYLFAILPYFTYTRILFVFYGDSLPINNKNIKASKHNFAIKYSFNAYSHNKSEIITFLSAELLNW